MENTNKVAPEAAAAEVERIGQFFGVDLADADLVESRQKLLRAAEAGRLMLDEEKDSVVLILARSIELDNGSTLNEIAFGEPTAGDLKVLDKYGKGESMARTIHLLSKMTDGKVPAGVIERLRARDLVAAGAIAALFF